MTVQTTVMRKTTLLLVSGPMSIRCYTSANCHSRVAELEEWIRCSLQWSQVIFSAGDVSEKTAYPKQAEMGQGEDSGSSRHILRDPQREILVGPTRVMWAGRPGPGVKNISKVVGRLWTYSVVTVVNRKSNADLDARCHRYLEPITSVNKRMVVRVANTHR